MAENNRPHFIVPKKKIIKRGITPTGRTILYKRDDYKEHGSKLISEVKKSRAEISKALDSELTDTLFIEISTPPEFPIKNEKKRFKDIGIDLVSYSERSNNIGIAKISSTKLNELEERLERYSSSLDNIGKTNLSIIENISTVTIEDKISEDILKEEEGKSIRSIIYLYGELAKKEKEAIIHKMEEYMTDKEGEFINHHVFSTGEATAVINAPLKTLKALGQNFTTLRQITPDHLFFVTDSTPISPLPTGINVNPSSSNICVAVFDSGIQPNCTLLSPLLSGTISSLPNNSISPHYEHGTYVASRIVFGDDIETELQNHTITPVCKLIDVALIGKNSTGQQIGPDEQELAIAIDKATNGFSPEVRVANISLGSNEAIKNDTYSLVATIIDQLSREKDILFITTAGNIRDERARATYPNHLTNPSWRIDLPGESLLALTIGSIARYSDEESLSRINELSPFSRIGPGSDGGVKPELVAHGGNCRKNGRPISRIATQGISGDGSHLAWDIGTSFSAPLVSSIAAQLFGYYGAVTSNLVKALLCHFTTEAIAPNNIPDSKHCVGFGVPNLTIAKSAGQNSAAFLCESIIDKENYLFVPFFVPAAMGTTNKNSKLRIKGTLVFDPPVQTSNKKEYSCARISMSVVKPNNGTTGLVNLTSENVLSRLAWNPIVMFDKLFSRAYSSGEWWIRLRLWTRGSDNNVTQKFALVVEVIDDFSSVDVWAEISAEAGNEYIIRPSQVA